MNSDESSTSYFIRQGIKFGTKAVVNYGVKHHLSHTQTRLYKAAKAAQKYRHDIPILNHHLQATLKRAKIPAKMNHVRSKTACKSRYVKEHVADKVNLWRHQHKIPLLPRADDSLTWHVAGSMQMVDPLASGWEYATPKTKQAKRDRQTELLQSMMANLARYTSCPLMREHQRSYMHVLLELLTTSGGLRHVPRWECHYTNTVQVLSRLEPLNKINEGLAMCYGIFQAQRMEGASVHPDVLELFEGLCVQRHARIQESLLAELVQKVPVWSPVPPVPADVYRQRYNQRLRAALAW